MASAELQPRATPRAARTRAAILAAAEELFSQRGFDATRLEDVAEHVGIRRASIVYHFKDKSELYDFVLESVFGSFRDQLAQVLSGEGSVRERIEAAVHAWVDTVGERPSLARLLLREVADAQRGGARALARHAGEVAVVTQRFLKEARREMPRLSRTAPAHLASTIAGASVFFVAAMPSLSPEMGFDPLAEGPLDAHRRELIEITRRFLDDPANRGGPR